MRKRSSRCLWALALRGSDTPAASLDYFGFSAVDALFRFGCFFGRQLSVTHDSGSLDTFAVDSAARPEQNAGVGLHRKIPWYQGKLQGIFFAHHAIALRCSKTERRSPSSIVQKQYCHQIEWYSSIGLAELIYDVKPQDWNLTKKSNDFVSFTRLIENIFR